MKLPARSNFADWIDNRSRTVSCTAGYRYSARSTTEIGTDDFTINGISDCSVGRAIPGGTPWDITPPSIRDSP